MSTVEHCLGCPDREYGPAIGTRGDPASRIVLVGEAPGAQELVDEQPFVGRAGDRLWKAVGEAGLSETDVFVVNSVACRPYHPGRPKVRKPSDEAILACHGRLARDIAAYPGSVIAALGVTAVQALTSQKHYPVMKKEQRTELTSLWGPVVPTLHPAFVLRRSLDGPEFKTLVADLKHVREVADR